MGMRDRLMKPINQNDIIELIKCPYDYRSETSGLLWLQIVQRTVDKVIYAYHELPKTSQKNLKILQLINQYWEKESVKIFNSTFQYYMVLAKLTDHLLHFLDGLKSDKSYSDFMNLETNLGLIISKDAWECGTLSVKKYLIHCNFDMASEYKDILSLYSFYYFQRIPEEIEIIDLMSGNSFSFQPHKDDMNAARNRLNVLKNTNPEYSLSAYPCETCRFHQECIHEEHKPTQILFH